MPPLTGAKRKGTKEPEESSVQERPRRRSGQKLPSSNGQKETDSGRSRGCRVGSWDRAGGGAE